MKRNPNSFPVSSLMTILIFLMLLILKTSHASQQTKDNMETLRKDVPVHKCTGTKIVTDGRCTHENDRSCSDL